MKNKIVLFVFCMILWTGINWPPDNSLFLTGVLLSLVVIVFFGDIFTQRGHLAVHANRYLWIAYFVGVVFVEMIKANADIIYRVLQFNIMLSPGIVKVKTNIQSETGLLLLANSITLSQGTCTVDIDAREGCLYVYWMNVESQNIAAATERVVGKFEKILKRAFDSSNSRNPCSGRGKDEFLGVTPEKAPPFMAGKS